MKKTFCVFTFVLLSCFSYVMNGQHKQEKSLVAQLKESRGFFHDNLHSKCDPYLNKEKLGQLGVDSELVKTILIQMLDGTYPIKDRVKSYKNYIHPEELAKELRTSKYSQFENPTGIFFKNNEEALLIVSGIDTSSVKLRITNFGEKGGDSTYELQNGYNTIIPQNEGNGYIEYFTPTAQRQSDVQIHILGGHVNGVFDVKRGDTNKDWVNLLANAPSDILDIVGDRVQLAYTVNSLKKYCPNDGESMMMLYDSIISMQHTIMGLNKYNRRPENHIFGRVIWDGFMHADQLGAAFHDLTMPYMLDPDAIKEEGVWGIAHEFGHVNQVRPWMTWVGTTEVTNNIYSVWAQYTLFPDSAKLEREFLPDYDGDVEGGRITAYMESAFIRKQAWLSQGGVNRWEPHGARGWGGDHFVHLTPFWQLQLYFKVAGKGNSWYHPDFYGDVFIRAIDRKDPFDHGVAQLTFIKDACDVTQTDLTPFFEQSGMLTPIDRWQDDYTSAQLIITAQQIADLKTYAAKYKKADSPVMHYITANSADIFKNRRSVKGKVNEGIDDKGDYVIVDHDKWQNAIAYETYASDKLIKIAFAGAGSRNKNTTLVRYPNNATKIEAVSWDGKRTLVYKR